MVGSQLNVVLQWQAAAHYTFVDWRVSAALDSLRLEKAAFGLFTLWFSPLDQ